MPDVMDGKVRRSVALVGRFIPVSLLSFSSCIGILLSNYLFLCLVALSYLGLRGISKAPTCVKVVGLLPLISVIIFLYTTSSLLRRLPGRGRGTFFLPLAKSH